MNPIFFIITQNLRRTKNAIFFTLFEIIGNFELNETARLSLI